MFGTYLKSVLDGNSLKTSEAYSTARMMIHEQVPPAQAAALLGALRIRKESYEELSGFVDAIYEEAVKMVCDYELIDTCGTGGDGLGTFNISTAAALIVASSGVAVAKHGNRAISGTVGSADILEALGVNVQLDPAHAQRMLDKVGITFLYAPYYHPILKQVGPLRREIGVATIFNFLGPLLNPCNLTYQLMGLADSQMLGAVSRTIMRQGRKRAMVIHADNGMDEISPASSTRVYDIREKHIEIYDIHPSDAGIKPLPVECIKGGRAEYNARIMIDIVNGKSGPYRDAAVLNAAAALVTAGRGPDMKEAAQIAAESIDSGKTRAVLQNMISYSRDRVLVC